MKNICFISAFALASLSANAQQIHFSFDNNEVKEEISKKTFSVEGFRTLPYMPGIKGNALRLDGYSNYVKASGLDYSALNGTSLTISLWCAAETYPMMNTAEAETTPSFATLAGNLDEKTKTGFAFLISSQGGIQFKCYLKSWILTCDAKDVVLPTYKWNNLVATIDKSSNKIYLYLNGQQVGTAKCPYELSFGNSNFMIGKSSESLMADGFHLNTFNGLIDEITISNKVLSADEVASAYDKGLRTTDNGQLIPDLTVPSSAFADNIWRPQFHGMPSHAWTNECHGMTYSDGKYHLFFQKNANGPYMARLHWGHISSPDLCQWTEEPIAIAPAEKYDIKGCWSGCVYNDAELTDGKPGILYTAVDNARATICGATPDDETLLAWNKANDNPLINGRPSGLSDDFRDPYFFTAGGNKYIIVGTSKDGRGACTLHKWNGSSWSNDGAIFFQATNAAQQGTFWEMPNVTPMADGRYLFTCTPLGMSVGVKTIYWVGTISADGKFTPEQTEAQDFELSGISKDGYGLLSPTIFQKDGKTICLGIVPDKLPTSVNLQMGWAHNYSLPRELSLAADGTLLQKPYSGLTSMRTATSVALNTTLDGRLSLSPVSGRQVELLGSFTIAEGKCGFRLLKSGSSEASITYDSAFGTITLDLTSLSREVNDNAYGGIYSATLPKRLKAGDTLKLNVFLDGSILDIFINDSWAFSVRVFPKDASNVEIEAFATSPTKAVLQAWTLDAENASTEIRGIMNTEKTQNSGYYSLTGISLNDAPTSGMYIHNGKKYVVR